MNTTLKHNKAKVKFDNLICDIQFKLYNFILSLVPHKQDAQDILQKTNLILCEKRDTFDPSKGSFQGWSFRIAKFQVMAHRTKCTRSRIVFSDELIHCIASESTDRSQSKIQKLALNKCYAKLPEHMHTIADLRFKRDLTIKQISSQLNRPIGSISATLHRIRSNIAGCIKQAYQEAEKEFYN
jgi:RNA polymerase sigma-70 factor (ECF subfamily)